MFIYLIMPPQKVERLNEISKLIENFDFNVKEFLDVLEIELQKEEVSFSSLRHFKNKEGKDMYVETWKEYRNKLREEGVSSKVLILQYHHRYSNLFNSKMFSAVVNYIRK